MAKKSYEKLKAELDEACTFLRSFTLGKQGFTQRDGTTGIQRVTDAFTKLKDGFGAGPEAQQVAMAVATAKANIEAAKARLALLKNKSRPLI